jgi:uncharacterized protein (TIGR02808 family)
MSALESIFWHVLGYSAIPVIVLAGIFISTLIFFGLVRLLGGDKE